MRSPTCGAPSTGSSPFATRDFLLGPEFSAADVMLGFTLAAAQFLGVLDARYPTTMAYLARITARPAFQRATAD